MAKKKIEDIVLDVTIQDNANTDKIDNSNA